MMNRNVISIAGALLLFGDIPPAAARSSVVDGPVPVTVLTSDDIDAGGIENIQDVLNRMPVVNLGDGRQLGFDPGTAQVNLRGLGSDRTLVLVNGRRTSPNSFGFSNVAIDQIERIDVCRDGAAAIYGSDAVAGVVNVVTKPGKSKRSAFATENGGLLINPAVTFRYDQSGAEYGAELDFCIDTPQVLPATLDFSLSAFDLTGNTSLANVTFNEGFGVTGIGGIPGVFVGAPTDLIQATFDSKVSGFRFSTDLTVPLNIGVRGPRPNPGGLELPAVLDHQRPSLDVTNLIVGLTLGGLDQSESTMFDADTPAFGLNSAWQGDYHTNFDGHFYGGYVGVGFSRTYFGPGDSSTTFSLSGTVGYNAYDFDVRESVMATGLGGALNYSNNQVYSFTDGLFTSSLTASVDWRQDNWTLGAFVAADTGLVPEIERHLPDSDIFGPLNPEYSIKAAPVLRYGLFARVIF